MSSSLGSENFVGSLMKSNFGDSWNGTNLSGFTGLPGGVRGYDGYFYDAGYLGYWWSSSPNGSDAWSRGLGYNFDDVFRTNLNPRDGLSVRCVRNAE